MMAFVGYHYSAPSGFLTASFEIWTVRLFLSTYMVLHLHY
jgi:hypothetical protein